MPSQSGTKTNIKGIGVCNASGRCRGSGAKGLRPGRNANKAVKTPQCLGAVGRQRGLWEAALPLSLLRERADSQFASPFQEMKGDEMLLMS